MTTQNTRVHWMLVESNDFKLRIYPTYASVSPRPGAVLRVVTGLIEIKRPSFLNSSEAMSWLCSLGINPHQAASAISCCRIAYRANLHGLGTSEITRIIQAETDMAHVNVSMMGTRGLRLDMRKQWALAS